MESVEKLTRRIINEIKTLQIEIERTDNKEIVEQLERRIKLHKDTIYQVLKIDYIRYGGNDEEYMEFVDSLLKENEIPKQEHPKKITESFDIMKIINELNNYEFYKFEDDAFKILYQLYNLLKSGIINLLYLKPSIEKNKNRDYIDMVLKLFMEGMEKWTASNKKYSDKNCINNHYHAELLCNLLEYDNVCDNFQYPHLLNPFFIHGEEQTAVEK